MERSRHGLLRVAPIASMIVPLVYYELLRRSPYDALVAAPTTHFIIVSAASLLSGVFALLVGVAGRAQRNVQVIFLSLSFMSLAFLFALHGLSTPGFILPVTPVPGIAAQVSIFVAAIWLALSSLSSDCKAVAWLGRRPGLLVGSWTAVLALTIAFGLAFPMAWAHIPLNSPPFVWPVMAATMLLSLTAAIRYWRSFVYSRTPLPHAVVYACVWLAVAQWIMTTSELWRESWWLYHFLLVGAVLALLVGVSLQYLRGSSLSEAVRVILLADPIRRLEVGLSPSVRALVLATEAHDPYTAGHSYRVAVTAVRIGQALRLSPKALRALAIGGLVHDVGKIEIADRVLNKAGKLNPEERRVIEKHPAAGYVMCRHLGFMELELGIIRHHHERWDGTGYPDGLAGERIPLLARILAVADVYDALTSKRSYRDARTHEAACAFITQNAGTLFDPRCVEAWERLSSAGPVVSPNEVAPWSEQPEAGVS